MHLRVKRFYGTSANAVKTQLWVALIVYLLVVILRKRLGIESSTYTILQVLSVTLCEKMSILQTLEGATDQLSLALASNQLSLFD